MKVLLIADLKGWIFERHCREIKNRSKYDCDIVYSRPHRNKIKEISKDYDIVYALDPMPLNYPEKEKVIMGCRAEWLHGPGNELDFYNNGLKKGCRNIKDKCSIFHVVNKRQYEAFKDIVTDKPFYLAQHGINKEVFNSDAYKRDFKGKEIVIGTSGRKSSNNKKGFDLVQKACNDLGLKFTTATYEGKKLTMEEMPSFYNKIDVYVCMSKTEGLCNPIMEAGAMGIPVISTSSGAAPEMVFNDKTGLLIDRNVKALKTALKSVQEYDYRRTLGKNMEEEIMTNWVWEERIKDYDIMFDKMMEMK